MWSPYHFLYKIRKDQLYSDSIETFDLKGILNTFDEIISIGELYYRNRKQYPCISILIVSSDNGNFTVKDHKTTFKEINLIEIQTSKDKDLKDWYLNFMTKIAQKLNWELILSEDDYGNEDILIWKSGENSI
ncbi:hypothetical protein [Aureispira sp. CCB-E]|uniref:hypothetical protein n=1 Tax=Aureispira sp. CCB-E TaxID=3051121 RepID=UPI0028694D64|nr:hypothetical protein [Aureispira sp. CCB-E]WMX17017.1 hypothetical protein QP953_11600 [Aureispira sp. CCB-E]